MSPLSLGRPVRAFLVTLGLAAVSACQSKPEPEAVPSAPAQNAPAVSESGDKPATGQPGAIDADDLNFIVAKHLEGLGLMEQYQYERAEAAFREAHQRAPDWVPCSINLAIALLNAAGVEAESARSSGGGTEGGNFGEALGLLAGVLEKEPNNAHAHYCRGIILEQQGKLAEAHQNFERVTEIDPSDAMAWYWLGSTLVDPADPSRPAGPEQAPEQMRLFAKALERDPYLTPAIYKMALASRFLKDPNKTRELFALWKKLDPDRLEPSPGPGTPAGKVYGEMGKYASIISSFPLPGQAPEAAAVPPPRFGPVRPLRVKLADGRRWAARADFQGGLAVLGRVRDRFGAAVAAFDADGDGRLDLYLAAAVVDGDGRPRDALLINKGDGAFEDASDAFGLPGDRASTGVAAGDFDADRHIDVFLTGLGGYRLLRNTDGKSFEDITGALPRDGRQTLSLTARWLDLDQDGDLDLYIVNYCLARDAERAFLKGSGSAERPPAGFENLAVRNDGQPEPIAGSPEPAWAPLAVAWENVKATKGLSIALSEWPAPSGLRVGPARHTGAAVLDLDGDRDLDLLVSADDAPMIAVLNDRLGRFRDTELLLPEARGAAVSGLLATDFDADGRTDLVAPRADGTALAWRNVTERTTAAATRPTFEPWSLNASRWRSAQAIDLDLDGRADLLGTPALPGKPGALAAPAWARNELDRHRFAARTLALGAPSDRGAGPAEGPKGTEKEDAAAEALASAAEALEAEGLAAVDLIGGPLPDLLVVRPGKAPALAENLGNGQHWLALQLGGHWRVKPELMRTNPHAIGTRVIVEGRAGRVVYDHTTPDAGLGQSVAPVVLGLGSASKADLVHLHWPDGVIQGEMNIAADQRLVMAENNRKTGSCPVLFTWNGRRFTCVGDFLGGGGLGYLLAPGVYAQPDRDEAIAISSDQLQADASGRFRLSITEPMDETAYLDHLRLDVVDRPPGVSIGLDERSAPEGARPTGALFAWRERVRPVQARDLNGRDLNDVLEHWDRRTADGFRVRAGWTGYAEEHGIVLDFGDRLSRFSERDRLVLCLAGWVEYPYSQTNYAAATAGVVLAPPAIERLRDDGTWALIEPHAGHPAGLPRMTALDLTGKLNGPRCVLRIKTNMECYYDQAFIAVRDRAAEAQLRVQTLSVASAELGYRGYTREVSPDGRAPLLYDYDHVDPAPLARFSGKLTRYGDVAALFQADDDRLCVMGPGDEARITFDARQLAPPPSGWSRGYVLRAFGHCKDADPFTAESDRVGPLPWRGMPAFPFGPDAEAQRPSGPGQREWLRKYQVRPAGEGE